MNKCPVCGAENNAGSKFCQFCGAGMAPAAVTYYDPASAAPGHPSPSVKANRSTNGMLFYDNYGSRTVSALRIINIVFCSLIAAAGLVSGIILMTQGEWYIALGFGAIIAAAAYALLMYFLFNIPIIQYRNFSLTGRNTEAQFHAIVAQNASIEQLVRSMETITLSVERLQSAVAGESNEKQTRLLEDIVRQQALLSDLVRENTEVVQQCSDAGDSIRQRMLSDAENEHLRSEDWHARTEKDILSCVQAIDALPERMSAMLEPIADRIAEITAAAAEASASACEEAAAEDVDTKHKVVPKPVSKSAPKIVPKAVVAAESETAVTAPHEEEEIVLEPFPEPEDQDEIDALVAELLEDTGYDAEPDTAEPEDIEQEYESLNEDDSPLPEAVSEPEEKPLSLLMGPGGDL